MARGFTFYLANVVAESLSHVQHCTAIPWTAVRQASLSFAICQILLKLISIESVIAIQPSQPLSVPSPVLSLSQHQCLFQ